MNHTCMIPMVFLMAAAPLRGGVPEAKLFAPAANIREGKNDRRKIR